MKKMLAAILAMILLCATGCATAEDAKAPLFSTIGDAVRAGGEEAMRGGYDDYYAVALEMDGQFIRVVADMDEKAQELRDAIAKTEKADDMEAAFKAFEAYILELPVSYIEEITAAPKDQAELDALVGKTIGDLDEAGYDYSFSGELGEENRIVFRMTLDLFDYDFVVDTDTAGYEAHQENGSYDDLVIRSAQFSGLSHNASELRFHADGTVEEEEEDLFGEYNALMTAISDAIAAAEEGGEVDTDAIMAALKEKFPEEAEMIEAAIQMYLLMNSGVIPQE